MSQAADSSEPASELERLIADLSASGPLVFVFGVDWWTAHLAGVTAPVFGGPADRRWWQAVLGDDAASWTMHVGLDQITGVRFVRGRDPFPAYTGEELVEVQLLGPGEDAVLYCYVGELAAWQALRERYGNRDESRVDQGTLLAPAS